MAARTPPKSRKPPRPGPERPRAETPRAGFDLLRRAPSTELEARYQALLNSTRDAILISDPEDVLECNPAARELFRMPPEEIVGKPLRLFIAPPPEDDPSSERETSVHIDRALEGEPQIFEYRRRRADGTLLFAEVSLSRFDVAGRKALCAIIRDCSERRRTEQTLRESETRFRELFANMRSAVAVYEAKDEGNDFVFVDFNQAGERIEEVRRDEIVGRSVLEVFPGVREFGLFDVFRRVWQTGRSERHPVSLYKDRRIAGWRDNYLYKLPTGEIVAIYDDVTEQMQMVEALQESMANFRALAENANDGIIIAADDESLVYANQRAAEITGYDAPGLTGIRVGDLVAPDHLEEVRARLGERLRGGPAPRPHETEIVRPSGERIPVEVTAARSVWEGRPVAIVILRDIAERRRLEEELRQSQKMDAIARLAGGIAHDFNNLLMAINGYARIVMDALPPEDPLRRDLGEILKAGQRAADLTRRLLVFGRPEMVETQILNLNTVLANIGDMLRPILGEDMRLVTVQDPDLGVIRADLGHVEQIIVNLAVNARDAMPQGGTLTIETANVRLDEESSEKLVRAPAGPYVLLKVTDTGVGMDAETRQRAFEPFFTTKDRERGSGLGLSIVYGIVRQYRGDIRLHSEPGAGTSVEVYLPREGPHEDVPGGGASREGARGGSETVLVVEDEGAVRSLAVRGLEKLGYAVLVAGTGEEALEIARRPGRRIDAVLTDVVLPGMSGPRMVAGLKEIHPGAKVLYMSGYADSTLAHHGVSPAEAVFVNKPVTVELLSRKLRRLLDEG